jgi:hypothetical protein
VVVIFLKLAGDERKHEIIFFFDAHAADSSRLLLKKRKPLPIRERL